MFPIRFHASGVFFDIYRHGQAQDLQIAGRDAQPGGEIADDTFTLLCVLKKKIHRQDFKYPDEPAVPGTDHALINISDRQTTLQIIVCGCEFFCRVCLRAEDQFFCVHI